MFLRIYIDYHVAPNFHELFAEVKFFGLVNSFCILRELIFVICKECFFWQGICDFQEVYYRDNVLF